MRHFCRTLEANRLDAQFFFQSCDHAAVLLVAEVDGVGIGDGEVAAELKAALILGDNVEMQVRIGIAEGGQIDLGAAPQLLDSTGCLCQIVGIVNQLLCTALAQLLLSLLVLALRTSFLLVNFSWEGTYPCLFITKLS